MATPWQVADFEVQIPSPSKGDLWGGFAELKSMQALEMRYDPETQTWSETKTLVKIQGKSFAEGGMRVCFRAQLGDPPENYVCKRYKGEFENDVGLYRDDVVMQMRCKDLAALYNAARPPRHIDVVEIFLLQLIEQPGRPYYLCEDYVHGPYLKHNNNGGAVGAMEMLPDGSVENNDDKKLVRNTPQAFTHFTFEDTNGEEMCCDIQGVDDVYTDPQIHSSDGCGYGAGNRGAKGMAMFFSSHVCNSLCKGLRLRTFEHPQSLVEEFLKERQTGTTVLNRAARTITQHNDDAGAIDVSADLELSSPEGYLGLPSVADMPEREATLYAPMYYYLALLHSGDAAVGPFYLVKAAEEGHPKARQALANMQSRGLLDSLGIDPRVPLIIGIIGITVGVWIGIERAW